MAKRKSANTDEDSVPASKAKDLVARVRRRAPIMMEADHDNRTAALDDLKFLHVPGAQWDEATKKARGKERACLEFNKLRVTVKRVVNDMRANRPAGKVRAVEDGDKDTADVYSGLIRNIWNVSDADTVIDYAGEYQVGGGMGAWRVNTRYSTNSTFDQDIVIEPIKNPFCLYADPAASDPIKRDAEDWLLTDRISKTKYERDYPDKEVTSFDESEFDDADDWADENTVRICEYWWKEPAVKQLCLLSDGTTIDKSKNPQLPAGVTVVEERTVRCPKIMMAIVSGEAVLDGPKEWAGEQFPFVQVYGEWLVIDGKVVWFGLTRHSRDAQKAYNISRTATTEKAAMSTNAKYWATAEQMKGHVDKWNESFEKNLPFLGYNPDLKAPGPPVLMQSDPVPVALIQEANMASEDIKATSGIFDPSLGNQSNETSGRAIAARQRQGEIATYNYADNMGKGIRRTWEILIDLVPRVYDTARSVRVLGVDGAEKYEKINQSVVDPKTMTAKPVNDLTRGTYDVTVTVGPSFATQRQEAAETYTQMAQADPGLMATAGDLVYKSMDLPYATEIAERRRMVLPTPIQQQLAEGKPIPPEIQMALQRLQEGMAAAEQQSQLLQRAAQEIEQSKAESEKAKAEAAAAAANVKTQEAQFKAYMAEQMAKFAQAQAQAAVKGAQEGVSADRDALSTQMGQAIVNMQQAVAAFMQQVMQTLAEFQARTQPQVIVPSRPRLKALRGKRVNGELVAVPEYEDTTQ